VSVARWIGGVHMWCVCGGWVWSGATGVRLWRSSVVLQAGGACEREPLTASIQPRLDGSTPAGWTRITSSSNPHGSADDGSLATRLFLLCIALNLCVGVSKLSRSIASCQMVGVTSQIRESHSHGTTTRNSSSSVKELVHVVFVRFLTTTPCTSNKQPSHREYMQY
jgi:hypothetical protein